MNGLSKRGPALVLERELEVTLDELDLMLEELTTELAIEELTTEELERMLEELSTEEELERTLEELTTLERLLDEVATATG